MNIKILAVAMLIILGIGLSGPPEDPFRDAPHILSSYQHIVFVIEAGSTTWIIPFEHVISDGNPYNVTISTSERCISVIKGDVINFGSVKSFNYTEYNQKGLTEYCEIEIQIDDDCAGDCETHFEYEVWFDGAKNENQSTYKERSIQMTIHYVNETDSKNSTSISQLQTWRKND